MSADLTDRERQVLEQVVEGLSSKQIAARLALSPKTVDIHRGRIREKLGARNTADLVRKALTIGRDVATPPLDLGVPRIATHRSL